ncbi:MAG: hypothetical protein GJT30_02770 [Geobacter sp.]|nr:hypothetical protein [Geobacter sp.]
MNDRSRIKPAASIVLNTRTDKSGMAPQTGMVNDIAIIAGGHWAQKCCQLREGRMKK